MCPKQFELNDKLVICQTDSDTGVERLTQSSPSRGRAQKNVDDLNEHEANNGREQSYYYREIKPGELDEIIKHNSQFGR